MESLLCNIDKGLVNIFNLEFQVLLWLHSSIFTANVFAITLIDKGSLRELFADRIIVFLIFYLMYKGITEINELSFLITSSRLSQLVIVLISLRYLYPLSLYAFCSFVNIIES